MFKGKERIIHIGGNFLHHGILILCCKVKTDPGALVVDFLQVHMCVAPECRMYQIAGSRKVDILLCKLYIFHHAFHIVQVNPLQSVQIHIGYCCLSLFYPEVGQIDLLFLKLLDHKFSVFVIPGHRDHCCIYTQLFHIDCKVHRIACGIIFVQFLIEINAVVSDCRYFHVFSPFLISAADARRTTLL